MKRFKLEVRGFIAFCRVHVTRVAASSEGGGESTLCFANNSSLHDVEEEEHSLVKTTLFFIDRISPSFH